MDLFFWLFILALAIVSVVEKNQKEHKRMQAVLMKKQEEQLNEEQYNKLEREVLQSLGLDGWKYMYPDAYVCLKSGNELDNYTSEEYLKDNKDKILEINRTLSEKADYFTRLSFFLKNNNFKDRPMYYQLHQKISDHLLQNNFDIYCIGVSCPSSERSNSNRIIKISKQDLDFYTDNSNQRMPKNRLKLIPDLDAIPGTVRCHYCNALNPDDAEKCERCGRLLNIGAI